MQYIAAFYKIGKIKMLVKVVYDNYTTWPGLPLAITKTLQALCLSALAVVLLV